MGLFDRIKDNARDLSMKAIEATREEIVDEEQNVNEPAVAIAPAPVEAVEEPVEAEYLTGDEQEPESNPIEEPAEEPEPKEEPAKETDETVKPRRSKVVEVSKSEYESSKKAKQAEETKRAAKKRLAESYTPSYKAAKSTADKPETNDEPAKETKKASRPIPVGIIDVTPGKFTDPTKEALYARERAALNAIASRRKLDGSVPIYVATHMNFKTRVFIDRIEYSGSFGKTNLPMSKVSWVKLRASGTGIIIETTEGKRLVMVVKPSDRLAFADAVLKVQSMQPKRGKFKDTKTIRIDELEKFNEGVDEIEKLAKLYDKGILSREEFDQKKKQILGI